MVKRVAVSVGHNPENPGFKVNNVSEYSEMSVLVGMVVQKIQRVGHEAYHVGTGELEEKVDYINAIAPDCAIELHLNAGGGHGYETLHYPGSVQGKALASSVNSSVGLVLNSRNRGIKEGWYRMDRPGVEDYQGDVDGDENIDYFLAQTNCPAIIFEMYFLDNAEERAKYIGALSILDAVADRIVVGILNYFEEG